MEFGKLKEVDVRELWKHEQYNFSEWLAKEENIEMLGDEVGVTFAEIRKGKKPLIEKAKSKK